MKKYLLCAVLLMVGCLAIGVILWQRNRAFKAQVQIQKIIDLEASEELILGLQRQLNTLSEGAMNLRLPDWNSRSMFADNALVSLIRKPEEAVDAGADSIAASQWHIGEQVSFLEGELPVLLMDFFTQLEHLKAFKIKLVRGHFGNTKSQFLTDIVLSGNGYDLDGNQVVVSGHGEVVWGLGGEDNWQIVEFAIGDFSSQKNLAGPLFVKSNGEVIASDRDRFKARVSIHEELMKTMLKTDRCSPPGGKFDFGFGYDTTAAHPGVSVVDINSDGWDDFYVMARWGENQLFVNQGDGTFVDQASDYGLNIMNHCTSAAFADFDNDGDCDLVLGRSFAYSQYFENVGGKFELADDKISERLPAQATSVAVADYNGDGLLDFYITTYGSNEVSRKLLPYSQQKILAKKSQHGDNHQILNSLGVPNVLYVNRGNGTFEIAPESSQLEFWQTTLSATWVDFDQDGDSDLYVSNDFGPDALMRNDFPNGFKDVTLTSGHPTMAGFGMGASWGDYDLDGSLDLYVSNMYSKAGLRIIGQIEDINPDFNKFVDGNRLYRQAEGHFEYTSGLQPPSLQVAKVGWSWGGQFADFDNDGFPDIYVTSGHFTAPEEVARGDDL